MKGRELVEAWWGQVVEGDTLARWQAKVAKGESLSSYDSPVGQDERALLIALIDAAIAEEREACAKIADGGRLAYCGDHAHEIAAAIRAPRSKR